MRPARSPGHPFYARLNRLLAEARFDRFVKDRCKTFYDARLGRPFAHCSDTGGMRRTHLLRGHGKILKRPLIHVAGFNLALVMRSILSVGTPRGLRDLRDLSAALLSPGHGLVPWSTRPGPIAA